MPATDPRPNPATPAQMTTLLYKCRDQFAHYAISHRQKTTNTELSDEARQDAAKKALVNEGFVREINDLLGNPPLASKPI